MFSKLPVPFPTPVLPPEVFAKLVKAIEWFYWLLIFEGALRKWLLVPLAKPLFFIKDPIVLYVYYICYKSKIFPQGPLWQSAVVLSLAILGLVFWQTQRGEISILTGLYGWRQYFFLLPFALLAGRILTGNDLRRIGRRTLLVGIPMSVIVFGQYKSPKTAFINREIDGDATFGYGDLVRASGTFTSTAGHELFCMSLVVFTLVSWLLPAKQRLLNGKLLWLATAATFINVLLNGNRGVYVMALIVILASLVYRLAVKNVKINFRTFAPELSCVVAFMVFIVVFPDAYAGIMDRFSGDDGPSRVGGSFSTIVEYLPFSSATGRGLGADSGAGQALMLGVRKQVMTNYNADYELGRIMVEAGALGLAFIFYRFAIAGQLVTSSYIASMRSKNPLPLILSSMSAYMIALGTITFNGTANGYAWLFVGFSLAASKLGKGDGTSNL